MQHLALALPTGWTMDALHKLISFGDGPWSVLPHLVAILVSAAVLGVASVRTFRYQ
jgi:ABC-type multidrug transport system permease subunit